MDLYEVSKFLRENTGKNNEIFNSIFKKYEDIKITNKELNHLKENFFLKKIKSKLDVINSTNKLFIDNLIIILNFYSILFSFIY